MLKCISWNIDSLNAALTSDSNRAKLSRQVLNTIKDENADIIALQEIKLPSTGLNKMQILELEKYFPDYNYEYISSTPPARKGYAGTMILYKNNLHAVKHIPKLNAPTTMDNEGRLITLEFDNFYFVNVYTPNSGDNLKRLAERLVWDKLYANYLKSLNKPVIACGDFNVAHKSIDIAYPMYNLSHAGFTKEERNSFDNLLNMGFIDTFRYINGNIPNVYSWWSQVYKFNKRNNVGWRIDYFLVSEYIKDKVIASYMMDSGERQDHTPIAIEIDL